MEELSIRKTNKYVGAYDYLDQWDTIGAFEVVQSKLVETNHDEDYGSKTYKYLVRVESAAPKAQIKAALLASSTSQGCACEHDCCGCANYSCYRAKRLGGPIWELDVIAYRNY